VDRRQGLLQVGIQVHEETAQTHLLDKRTSPTAQSWWDLGASSHVWVMGFSGTPPHQAGCKDAARWSAGHRSLPELCLLDP
jgi:hypothetical protein